jgi:hypothetical protein
MANLDLVIYVLALIFGLILTMIGTSIAKDKNFFMFLPTVYGMFSLGYIITNYSGINFGIETYPWLLFLVAYFFLGILVPLVIWIDDLL